METNAFSLLKKPAIFIPLLILFVLPWTSTNIHFHHVLIMFMLFATLSQAWNFIGGFAGQVSFGHATFFGIGAYASLVLLKKFDLSPWVGMLVGGGVSVVVAVVIGYPVFKLKGHYFAISTFAVAEIFERLFSMVKVPAAISSANCTSTSTMCQASSKAVRALGSGR